MAAWVVARRLCDGGKTMLMAVLQLVGLLVIVGLAAWAARWVNGKR